jgi:CRP/FNR family cyclic AMP-dependent transcriptional regulator
MNLSALDWIEVVGWLASFLTVATYAMNTMIPLRILAIGSSVCFLVYGLVLQVWPLLAMEVVLLPINCYRLWEILSIRRKVSQAKDGLAPDFSIIKTYGKRRVIAPSSYIFRQGDTVDRLYLLSRGQVQIEEVGVEISPGEIFGEIAFFTDASQRTASARSVGEVEIYEIDEKRFMRLQFEDPSFGLAIMRTVTRRLAANGRLDLGATPVPA